MIKFRQKDFSNYIVRDAIKGASLGATLGTAVAGLGFAPSEAKSWIPGHSKYDKLKDKYVPGIVYDKEKKPKGTKHITLEDIKGPSTRKEKDRVIHEPPGWAYNRLNPKTGKNYDIGDIDWVEADPGPSSKQKLAFAGATTILGAALGAIIGGIKTLKDISRSTNKRLLKQILPRLKSKGLVEGKDFTMDPKKANEIPTKVCIVLSSASGELQTIINSKDDPKLKKVVDGIVRKSPGRAQVSTQNNRFNEITITTEKRTAANVNQVVSIIESFVESGYPVYIVEVG